MSNLVACYTAAELGAMARNALNGLRKARKDRIRKYVFDETPWHITISAEEIILNVQIKNRENNWIENISIQLNVNLFGAGAPAADPDPAEVKL